MASSADSVLRRSSICRPNVARLSARGESTGKLAIVTDGSSVNLSTQSTVALDTCTSVTGLSVAHRLGSVTAAAWLVARGDLLHGPSVAVRVGEEDEPHVVQVLPVPGRARSRSADYLDLADLHPPLE
jgi:hypothetical protein